MATFEEIILTSSLLAPGASLENHLQNLTLGGPVSTLFIDGFNVKLDNPDINVSLDSNNINVQLDSNDINVLIDKDISISLDEDINLTVE